MASSISRSPRSANSRTMRVPRGSESEPGGRRQRHPPNLRAVRAAQQVVPMAPTGPALLGSPCAARPLPRRNGPRPLRSRPGSGTTRSRGGSTSGPPEVRRLPSLGRAAALLALGTSARSRRGGTEQAPAPPPCTPRKPRHEAPSYASSRTPAEPTPPTHTPRPRSQQPRHRHPAGASSSAKYHAAVTKRHQPRGGTSSS